MWLLKVINKFAMFTCVSEKQKLRFCKTMESVFSKHILTDLGSFALNIQILKLTINTLTLFSFQFNDSSFCNSIFESTTDQNLFFHGKHDLATAVSKVILICSDQVMQLDRALVDQNNTQHSWVAPNIVTKVMKLLNISLSYPDVYYLGMERLLGDKTEKTLSLLRDPKYFGIENKKLVSALDNYAVKLKKTIEDFFTSNCTIEDLYDDAEFHIKLFFKFVRNESYRLNSAQDTTIFEEEGELSISSVKQTDTARTEYFNESVIKSDFLYCLLYVLKVNFSFMVQVKQVPRNQVSMRNLTYKTIMRFLSYLVEDSPDNCIILFSSKFLKYFQFYLEGHFEETFNLIYKILTTLEQYKYDLLNTQRVIKLIDCTISTIKKDDRKFRYLARVMELYKMISNDFASMSNNKMIILDIKDKISDIIRDFPILTRFTMFLTDLGKTFRSCIMGEEHMNYDFEGGIDLDKYRMSLEYDKQSKTVDLAAILSKTKEAEFGFAEQTGYVIEEVYEVYERYLNLVNDIFDEGGTMNEYEELFTFMSPENVQNILLNMSLRLTLRVQVLRFFRMVYLDILIDRRELDFYKKEVFREENTGINQFLFNLTEQSNFNFRFFIQFTVVKHELAWFEQAIEMFDEDDPVRKGKVVERYLEFGLLLPLKIYLSKFYILLSNQKTELKGDEGVKNIQFFEIVLTFLRVKQKLLEHLSSEDKKLKYSPTSVSALNKQGKKNNLSDLFKKGEFTTHKRGFLINLKDTKEQLKSVKKTIDSFERDEFDLFDFQKIYETFDFHFKTLIKSKKSRSLANLFSKKEDSIRDKYDKIRLSVSSINASTSVRNFVNILVEYQLLKKRLESSSFMAILDEVNHLFAQNYRDIIVKLLFYIMHNTRMLYFFEKDTLNSLLILLQYDTKNIQRTLLKYASNSASLASPVVNIDKLSHEFVIYWLSILFSSYNPSSSNFNFEYYFGTLIVKILKYYCEEHNDQFQNMFYRKFCFYAEGDKMFTLVEFFLVCLRKLISLSKWDEIDFNSQKEANSYFLDMFLAISEFLVEVVQGTDSSNLDQFKKGVFPQFLGEIKGFLLSDKNDSELVYRVKLNIMSIINAIIEEQNTSREVGTQIAIELLPEKVVSSSLNLLKKLFIKRSGVRFGVENYKKLKFSVKMYEYFAEEYFKDESLSQTVEFQLALQMFKYVEILSNDPFRIKDACSITNSVRDSAICSLVHAMKPKFKRNKVFPSNEPETFGLNKYALRSIEHFYLASFFNQTLKKIEVRYEDEGNVSDISIYYVKHPSSKLLSSNTVNVFNTAVNRESRYCKLFDMMEYCDYFQREIDFNKGFFSTFPFLRPVLLLNYRFIIAFLFLICITMNSLLLISLENFKEGEEMPTQYFTIIFTLSLVQTGIAALAAILWIITKYPVYVEIERIKYASRVDKSLEELNFWEETYIRVFLAFLFKIEIFSLLFIIVLGVIGKISDDFIWIYSFQLLTITSLTDTLKNVGRAVFIKWKQLFSAMLFVFVCVFIFSLIGFYYLREDILGWDDGVFA